MDGVELRESPSAFAGRLGVNRATISRAIKAGRLLLGSDGLLGVEESLRRWRETSPGSRPDVSARLAAERAAKRGAAPAAVDDQETADAEGEPGGDDHAADRETVLHYAEQRLAAQNRLVMLGMELRAHKRYSRADVLQEAAALGGSLRAGIDRLIDQTAPVLSFESSPSKRVQLLTQAVAAMRFAFRREFPRALRRIRSRK